MATALMVQGAGSNVGKSLVVAGLARALLRRGLSVAPFKPQNMSNNAAVTVDGAEIGRAQALQARAAGRDPVVDMNPVLLKPQSERGAQIVVQGRVEGQMDAASYGQHKATLLPRVLESFERLALRADLILVEGAGSPAEVNLRAGDIANMGFAEAAGLPVVLIGDIDRGGVIAQIVGTHAVLPPDDRNRIEGFAVNKFRGDPALFADGRVAIAAHTGWRDLGLIPWFADAWRLPGEDSLDLASRGAGPFRIAVPRLNRIANFDDLDPLKAEPAVRLDVIPPGRALPGDADLVILPGSKATLADLAQIRAEGWDVDIAAHLRRGGHVLGLCGGYQMLGTRIADPGGVEGAAGEAPGLGLLDVETVLGPRKTLARRHALHRPTGAIVAGYEIHMGVTDGPDRARPLLDLGGRGCGAVSADGRVAGCYLHGLFDGDAFRRAWLAGFGHDGGADDQVAAVDATLDALADHLDRHLDVDGLIALARPVGDGASTA